MKTAKIKERCHLCRSTAKGKLMPGLALEIEQAIAVGRRDALAIELFAGTGSGTAGWCALGGTAACFDLEYLPHHGKPAARSHRVIQDVLTLQGSQFRHADFIWGSSPCQAYSYLAMPWSRSKCPLCKGTKLVYEWQLIVGVMKGKSTELGRLVACDCKENSAKAKDLRRKWELDGPDNSLFDSVSRIQREASAAAGRFIPFIQENVRGAVPWIGKRDMSLAAWKSLTQAERIKAGRPDAVFGSFYLWGCVAQIGNRVIAGRDLEDIRAGRGRFGMGVAPEKGELKGHGSTWFGIQSNGDTYDQREVNPVSGRKRNPDGTEHPQGSWFRIADSSQGDRGGVKVPGQIQGKEYAMCRTGAQGQTTLGSRDDSRRNDGRDDPARSSDCVVEPERDEDGMRESGLVLSGVGQKSRTGGGWFGDSSTTRKADPRDVRRQPDGSYATPDGTIITAGTKIGGDWLSDPNSTCRKHGSRSNARKAASALIAVIPAALSDYIARVHMPTT